MLSVTMNDGKTVVDRASAKIYIKLTQELVPAVLCIESKVPSKRKLRC